MPASPGVGRAPLGLCVGRILRLRRQLEHRCILPHWKSRQKHNLTVREFEGVVMRVGRFFVDLPEYRGLVFHGIAFPTKETALRYRYALWKGEFRSGKKTHGRIDSLRRGEAAGPGPEVARRELVPYPGRTGADVL
jgi:hypothetical protein